MTIGNTLVEPRLAALVANGVSLYEYLEALYNKPVYYQSDKASAMQRINEFKANFQSISRSVNMSDPIPFPAVLLYFETIRTFLRDALVPMCNILAKRVVQ